MHVKGVTHADKIHREENCSAESSALKVVLVCWSSFYLTSRQAAEICF